MKIWQILGALLIVAGVFVLVKGASYPSDKTVLKVGNVEANVEEHHTIPPWVGGAGLAVGVVLVLVGLGKRA